MMKNSSYIFNKRNIIALAVLAFLVIFVVFVFKIMNRPDKSQYYAVFLTNGQVYFGNIKEESESELVLASVYYLQAEKATQAQLAESTFSLIKMGNEIHGPTDEMFINKQNILFYEKLRADSKVVKSIQDNK